MFPNDDDYIDSSTIGVFLSRNPSPALVVGVYYCLHTRHEKKKGVLLSFAKSLVLVASISHSSKGAMGIISEGFEMVSKAGFSHFRCHGLGAENPYLLQKIKRAWTLIHRKGKKLRKRDCRAKEPYRQWVLKQTEKERGDNHHCFELAVKEKKSLRDESNIKIKKLKLSLRNANAKTERKRHLKKEAM
ncbi:hypothetical protein KIW84_050472 [Lathyrus oleraceus]|uniref:DUF7745 domain-containing protein n=1 Tax=Pisum sativum TaxID=3888 RepID=A0A9D4WLR5_PEA|nr:hypothetical protein KIW84_050472 [Pisum sativum]